jgi:predicted alpha/beta superfamily hydrolase
MKLLKRDFSFTRITCVGLFLMGFIFLACNRQNDSMMVLAKKERMFSKVLNEERTLNVYLPRGYKMSLQKYPVLFVLDADNMITMARIVGTTGEQSESGNIPEMIIIGIQNVDRERDMFPVRVDYWPNSGLADKFLQFLSEELIPYVDRHYRAENFRLLYGASNAGLFVVHTLFNQPDLFSAYIASSPTVGWCYEFIFEEARVHLEPNKSLNKFLYMIWGRNDMDAVTRAVPYLEKIIKEEAPGDLKWASRVIEDEGHVPYASLFKGFRFVFDGWNYPPERFQTATLDNIQTYYQALSDKYGFEVSIPMFVYLETGNNLRQRGKVKEAIDVFKVNLEHYPSDPNALFYLGEGYWDDGQKDIAIRYYRKALESNPLYPPAVQKLESLEKEK